MTLDEAQKILFVGVQGNGGLRIFSSEYVKWNPNDTSITLDGQFTVEELDAISVWIKAKYKPVTENK